MPLWHVFERMRQEHGKDHKEVLCRHSLACGINYVNTVTCFRRSLIAELELTFKKWKCPKLLSFPSDWKLPENIFFDIWYDCQTFHPMPNGESNDKTKIYANVRKKIQESDSFQNRMVHLHHERLVRSYFHQIQWDERIKIPFNFNFFSEQMQLDTGWTTFKDEDDLWDRKSILGSRGWQISRHFKRY